MLPVTSCDKRWPSMFHFWYHQTWHHQ